LLLLCAASYTAETQHWKQLRLRSLFSGTPICPSLVTCPSLRLKAQQHKPAAPLSVLDADLWLLSKARPCCPYGYPLTDGRTKRVSQGFYVGFDRGGL